MKAVRKAQTPEAAREALAYAIPIIDRTAGKGIIHKNAAARYKSNLHAFVEKLATTAATPGTPVAPSA